MDIIPPTMLLGGYARGIFPMSSRASSSTVSWFEPRQRGIFPMDGFHVSKNVQRVLRNTPFEYTVNTCFERVIRACGQRDETWISEVIVQSYLQLHHLGYAHSVEVWLEGTLVAGLYGVALGGAFFGESMFQNRSDLAKAALVHCHQRMQARGYVLWDTQYYTPHLGTMGCIEIPKAQYLTLLHEAIQVNTWFGEQAPEKILFE